MVAWLIGVTLLVAVIAALIWRLVFVQILPGEVGVRYSLLFGGTKTDEVLPEGFALKLPWDRVYIYEIRVQRMPVEYTALSLEGMDVKIIGTVLYRPIRTEVASMQKNIGPEYRERLVAPVAQAAIREITALYNSHELYSLDYEALRQRTLRYLNQTAASQYIFFDDVLIQNIALPPAVSDAIEQKLAQEQLAASYSFRLLSQKQEAERRRIEAIGIQTYYSIISQALTESLLTWRGIEATVELARSNNTKIVIVGGSKDQMPLILGSDITGAPTTPDALKTISPQQALQLPDWGVLPPMFPDLKQELSSAGVRDGFIEGASPGGTPTPVAPRSGVPAGEEPGDATTNPMAR